MIDRRMFVVGALACTAMGRKPTPPPPPPPIGGDLSLNPAAWTIGPVIGGQNYSKGMPLHPAPLGAGWAFDFPQADGVHYVTTAVAGSAVGRTAMALRFQIDGNAQFVATEGDASARVRLHFQRRGDNWGGAGPMASFRWYSGAFLELAPGGFTLIAPLVSEQWTNVYGQQDPAGFVAALNDIANIGMTFGGTFAGHGVYAAGAAKFICDQFTVA